jgi:hypothetical protein
MQQILLEQLHLMHSEMLTVLKLLQRRAALALQLLLPPR